MPIETVPERRRDRRGDDGQPAGEHARWRGWRDLAAASAEAAAESGRGWSCCTAEGRGFNAGVDIKEIQAPRAPAALVGVNRGCYAAFTAIYDCEVPVIAAVQGFCLGGGMGLAGNADMIVAADDATFGLPEVDRGALGAATHLARLVPQHKMRVMVYTCGAGDGGRHRRLRFCGRRGASAPSSGRRPPAHRRIAAEDPLSSGGPRSH